MRLAHAAKPNFARHETFHPRYGWFRKAYSYTAEDPKIFIQKDASVRIGVGKNMVRAIRFWGLAAKLIVEETPISNPRTSELLTTDLGNKLFGDSGWDKFMEDPGTLWLLHWLLLAPLSRLPVWWLAFNEFNAVEFTDTELELFATWQIESIPSWFNPHTSSIKKDVNTLLRTYAPAKRAKHTGIDEIVDCPLRELKLIGYSDVSQKYRFSFGDKPTLPSEILAYSILDFVARTDSNAHTITFNRLAHEPGTPGKIFKLSEYELIAKLEHLIHRTDSLNLISTAGATQLTWSNEPMNTANQLLHQYYCFTTDAEHMWTDQNCRGEHVEANI